MLTTTLDNPAALARNVQRTAPKAIYLQVGDNPLDMSISFDDLMRMGDVSWCQDKVFEADIPYVRADLSQHSTTQAAVAAALRKAADMCNYQLKEHRYMPTVAHSVEDAILALPHDDSALREICMRVAREVNEWARGVEHRSGSTEAIVDRVLGE